MFYKYKYSLIKDQNHFVLMQLHNILKSNTDCYQIIIISFKYGTRQRLLTSTSKNMNIRNNGIIR